MEKRLLVAIFLSFLVLYGYQVLVLKPAADKAKREAPAAATTAGAPARGPAAGTTGTTPGATVEAPTAQAPVLTEPAVSDAAERDVVVETRTIRAVFTNRGARLKSWKLKSYLDLRKRPQELVPSYLDASAARPFDLMVDDPDATARLKDALFQVSGGTPWTPPGRGRPLFSITPTGRG
jgi:YidC/Oxa1 family membrane protein insertase